jgi:hypothetical protein
VTLTTQQQATLKAFVLADPVLSLKVHNSDGAWDIANAINLPDPGGFQVWRSSTNADDIMDAITWANLTPADAADGTATYTNRALACQAKQLNLQIMLQGRATLGTGKASIRTGLADALTNVPAGVAGAALDAGWLGAGKVKAAITRTATVLEKLFATGVGTAATPGAMAVESPISYPEVSTAMGWG